MVTPSRSHILAIAFLGDDFLDRKSRELRELKFRFRRSREQSAGVVVLGARGDFFGGADFDDFSTAHHGDAVTEIAHHRHGVRDEEIGEAKVALELFEQVHDLRADADVKRGDGFVTNHKFGTQDQGAGNADALALSAGKFMGIAAERGFVEADSAEDFDGGLMQIGRALRGRLIARRWRRLRRGSPAAR